MTSLPYTLCSQCYFSYIYNPLHTLCRYWQTTTKLLFRKKIWILRNMAKTRLQTIRHRQQFLRVTCKFVWSNEKCLCVSFKDCYIKRRQCKVQNKKLVCETSARKFYTLFVFRNIFVGSPIFCGCLRTVLAGLQDTITHRFFNFILKRVWINIQKWILRKFWKLFRKIWENNFQKKFGNYRKIFRIISKIISKTLEKYFGKFF